jgi:hypothetical protein
VKGSYGCQVGTKSSQVRAEVWDGLNWYDVYAKFHVNMPICCKVIMQQQQFSPYRLEQYAKYSRVEMASSVLSSFLLHDTSSACPNTAWM